MADESRVSNADGARIPTTGEPPAIRIRGLTKAFGTTYAVAGIDLDVPAGSFFGLVGPNGAGKTTTLSMSTGLLTPDAGTVEIAGVDIWRNPVEAKRRIGVLPEGLRLFERLTGAEMLAYHGRLRGLPGAEVDRRAGELLEILDLSTAADKLVADYSTGMRKKVTLAAAMLHGPRVLLLDEPMEAVDPVSARVIADVLRGYTADGGTVVLSSHVMTLVEQLCDTVAVMVSGRIAASGPTADVRGAHPHLEDAFLRLVGATSAGNRELSWLRSSPA